MSVQQAIHEFKAAKAAAIVSHKREAWEEALAAYLQLRKIILNIG